MTVREAIAALQALDPDAELVLNYPETHEPFTVRVTEFNPNDGPIEAEGDRPDPNKKFVIEKSVEVR